MPLNDGELKKRFNHHVPKDATVGAAHDTVRSVLRSATKAVLDVIPDSRESALFITKMEEAMFWANAAVARNQ